MLSRRGEPTPPIAFGPGPIREHLGGPRIAVDGPLRARIAATGADVIDQPAVLDEASRDWWPLAMIWALDAEVAARAAVVVRPHDTDHPDLAEWLMAEGIESVSLNPDTVVDTWLRLAKRKIADG